MAARKKASQWVQISGYLFLLGIIVAVIAGLAPGVIPSVEMILLVVGVLIGLLGALGMGSISAQEKEMFLLATIALIAAGASGQVLAQIPVIGTYLSDIVRNIAALVTPAVVLLAIEAIWRTGSIKYKM